MSPLQNYKNKETKKIKYKRNYLNFLKTTKSISTHKKTTQITPIMIFSKVVL